jgi:hypothetical protein
VGFGIAYLRMRAMREPDTRDEQWFRFPRFLLCLSLQDFNLPAQGICWVFINHIMKKRFFFNLFLSTLLPFVCFQGMDQPPNPSVQPLDNQ